MSEGRIKFYKPEEGYGFIECDGSGKDFFFHISGVAAGVVPKKNMRVRYKLERGKKGLQAVDVEPVSVEASNPTRATDRPVTSSPATASVEAVPGEARSATPAPPPYGFASVESDDELWVRDAPITHDGNNPDQPDLISGELCCTLTALTPLLVANEQYQADQVDGADPDAESVRLPADWGMPWPVKKKKKVLEPLFFGGDENAPVLLPGEGIWGALRRSLAALLSAPLEAVAEASHSWRPNALFPQGTVFRQPCPAIVRRAPDGEGRGLVLDIYPMGRDGLDFLNDTEPDTRPSAAPDRTVYRYWGGIDGTGQISKASDQSQNMPTPKKIHHWVAVENSKTKLRTGVCVDKEVVLHYWGSLAHLADDRHGHISGSHPLQGDAGTPGKFDAQRARQDIMRLRTRVLQPDTLIYVEYDTNAQRVTSLGHNYFYRQTYLDTVRQTFVRFTTDDPHIERATRSELKPHPAEQQAGDDGRPGALTGARLLAGYASSSDPEQAIGAGNWRRLAGRVGVNMAIERIRSGQPRFVHEDTGCCIMRLKVLGPPRSSPPEHVLRQDPAKNRNDAGLYLSYGDLAAPDEHGVWRHEDPPGALRGRKFYLHQPPVAGDPTLAELDSELRLLDKTQAPNEHRMLLEVLTDCFPAVTAWPSEGIALAIGIHQCDPGLAHLKRALKNKASEIKAWNRSNPKNKREDPFKTCPLLVRYLDALNHLWDDQASLARYVSAPGSLFGCTIRFADLRLWELGALLAVMDPTLLADALLESGRDLGELGPALRRLADKDRDQAGPRQPRYALKLGHGKPLGLGSVRLQIDRAETSVALDWGSLCREALTALLGRLRPQRRAEGLRQWFEVHRYLGRGLADYPRDAKGQILGWHTELRGRHGRGRRQRAGAAHARIAGITLPSP